MGGMQTILYSAKHHFSRLLLMKTSFKCTMALTNMNSDLISVAPSGLPINYSEESLI